MTPGVARMYESEPQCGGHTLTDDSPGYPVDLGFQVCSCCVIIREV